MFDSKVPGARSGGRAGAVASARSSRGGGDASLDAAMTRYSAGDAAAFGEIYDLLAPRLFAFLLRRTGDRARAEDLVQQTMLNIHRARATFTPGASALPWAFAIGRRLLLDQHRRHERDVSSLAHDHPDEDLLASLDASADDIAMAKETARRLQTQLLRLPENQRIAFQLVRQESLSITEAAAILGTTASAVKLRAHRAYAALRAVLEAA